MRFWSHYKQARYTVIPDDFEYFGPNRRRKVPGLHAEFAPLPSGGGMFDSELAQRKSAWSDEQRIEVEEYLSSHMDFGITLHFMDVPDAPIEVEAVEQPKAACTFLASTPEGVEVCGRKPKAGSEFCAKHAKEVEAAEEEEAV